MNSSAFSDYTITNSSTKDLDFIFFLFDQAIAYQKANNHQVWLGFSRELIENDIAEGRHWKILHGDTIACIFSVVYSDPIIWGEANREPSVYLHRIAVNPAYKGLGMVRFIREWAEEHARTHDKKFVRMDTWGENEGIRKYYIECGFPYIGLKDVGEGDGLPDHYRGLVLSLFEIRV